MQVVVDLSQLSRPDELVAAWFIGAAWHVCLRDLPDGGDPPDWAHMAEGRSAILAGLRSDDVHLNLMKVGDPPERSRRLVWNEPTFHKFLEAVSQGDYHALLFVDLARNQEEPDPVNIWVTPNESSPSWAYLTVNFDEKHLRDLSFSSKILAFLRGFCDECRPTFGHVSPLLSAHRTALETLLRVIPDETLPTSNMTLRGYSWVTVCSQEIGERLGGLDSMRASGAFSEVAQLRAGGYWLQATQAYADYDMTAAERIFQVVAPALLAGMPMNPSSWRDRDRYKVVIEDAANFRTI